MLGVVFSIDICTLHRMSYKTVDLNICAHTWHSVSVMSKKQGFELAVPEIVLTGYYNWLWKNIKFLIQDLDEEKARYIIFPYT